jgi:hypothetical protein
MCSLHYVILMFQNITFTGQNSDKLSNFWNIIDPPIETNMFLMRLEELLVSSAILRFSNRLSICEVPFCYGQGLFHVFF